VLVIDDEPDMREMVAAMLVAAGYTVLTVPDGGAALRRLMRLGGANERAPDLILSDVQMPAMDGAAFLQAYRRIPGRHAPVVLMTASPERAHAVAHLGADVLLKPFPITALLDVVDRNLCSPAVIPA
jgi:CheY-like chemotaxis protein